MKELILSCKKALQEQRCLGCVRLENPDFVGDENCQNIKTPTAKECLDIIYKNLGVKQ